MRNLKRALSLALAAMMLIGMMVVSAGAASKDFTDKDEIVNDEAVNTLVALNVISGKEDGSYFDPTGIVTRAEMAKMITVVLNGGREPNLGTKTTPSFSDIDGHWAEAYIEYCTSLGIIAGRGNGKFDPDATVTGSEAAKMVLIAMGYTAENSNFVGSSWEINVNATASSKGLYDKMSVVASAPLNRDNAALMVYNGLNAEMVEYDYKLNTVNGNLVTVAIAKDRTGVTLLSDKFDLTKYEGYLQDASYDATNKNYDYSVAVAMGTAADNTAANGYTFTDVADDYSNLFGQKVQVLFKNGERDEVYGIFGLADVVAQTEVGELPTLTGSETSFKINGTEYKVDTTVNDVKAYELLTATNSALDTLDGVAAKANYTLKLIDNNNNGKIDSAVVVPFTVAKVTYVGAKSITAGSNYTFEDANIANGIEKGDYVKIIAAVNTVDNTDTVTKLDTIEGTVDGMNGDKVLINGTWYSKVANAGDAFALGETYVVSVIGKYYYNAEKVSDGATVKDIIYVAGAEAPTALKGAQAKIYTTEGTSSVVTVDKVGATSTAAGSGASVSVVATGIYTYKTNDDGNYELTAVSATNKVGYDSFVEPSTFTKASDTADAKLGTYTISKDAVLFVVTTDGVSVMSGATVNNWAGATLTSTDLLTKTVNGLGVVMAGLINVTGGDPSVSGQTGNFGYVVSAPYQIKDGNNTYTTYKIWNGSETVTVIEKASSTSVAKGSIISYTDNGDGYISSVTSTATSGAIIGFSDKTLVVRNTSGTNTTYAITDDTVIMYVDSAKIEGVNGGELALASENADGTYVQNVYVLPNGTTPTNLDLVVYEIGNEIVDTDGNSIATCPAD